MTAAEIIEMIKKLPPREKAEVTEFLLKNDGAVAEPAGVEEARVDRKESYLPHAEAERRAVRIFRENHELFRRLAQ